MIRAFMNNDRGRGATSADGPQSSSAVCVGAARRSLSGWRKPALARAATTQVVRRWGVWKPWAVAGSGAVVAALGALSYGAATDNFAAYDRGYETFAEVAVHGLRDARHQIERTLR